jgi:hypothetical protein
VIHYRLNTVHGLGRDMGRTQGRGGEGSTGLNMAGWELEGRVTLCRGGGGQQADYLY